MLSSTLSSSTMVSTASILFFKYITIQNGPEVIMVLLDNLSDLDKLNYDHLGTILNRFIFEK